MAGHERPSDGKIYLNMFKTAVANSKSPAMNGLFASEVGACFLQMCGDILDFSLTRMRKAAHAKGPSNVRPLMLRGLAAVAELTPKEREQELKLYLKHAATTLRGALPSESFFDVVAYRRQCQALCNDACEIFIEEMLESQLEDGDELDLDLPSMIDMAHAVLHSASVSTFVTSMAYFDPALVNERNTMVASYVRQALILLVRMPAKIKKSVVESPEIAVTPSAARQAQTPADDTRDGDAAPVMQNRNKVSAVTKEVAPEVATATPIVAVVSALQPEVSIATVASASASVVGTPVQAEPAAVDAATKATPPLVLDETTASIEASPKPAVQGAVPKETSRLVAAPHSSPHDGLGTQLPRRVERARNTASTNVVVEHRGGHREANPPTVPLPQLPAPQQRPLSVTFGGTFRQPPPVPTNGLDTWSNLSSGRETIEYNNDIEEEEEEEEEEVEEDWDGQDDHVDEDNVDPNQVADGLLDTGPDGYYSDSLDEPVSHDSEEDDESDGQEDQLLQDNYGDDGDDDEDDNESDQDEGYEQDSPPLVYIPDPRPTTSFAPKMPIAAAAPLVRGRARSVSRPRFVLSRP
ncbi:hypothetical protein ml_340 [Mollivirus sibericum]|uniref:hypothetical protein n=1 Tax=Mollivirus sibericum TaxID=1678078 RepID=UPI0006B2E9F4|nr:hypothetical protein ml_340 [Mollivirus sibericum]ALD62142.1 hypothetical protein ml_340 [Mollivirus sibericum]